MYRQMSIHLYIHLFKNVFFYDFAQISAILKSAAIHTFKSFSEKTNPSQYGSPQRFMINFL